MKKVCLLLGVIIIIIFLVIIFLINSNITDMKATMLLIKEKTDIKNIVYINDYGNYHIVKDNNYIYVFDNKFNELIKIDNIIVHENSNNYDIIYKDNKVFYFKDYIKKKKLYYEYYDIYNYKLVDTIVVGG